MINKQCNHLQDVQIEVDNSQEISILIGADYPYLHINRDRRNATAMNPEIYQHPYDRFYWMEKVEQSMSKHISWLRKQNVCQIL